MNQATNEKLQNQTRSERESIGTASRLTIKQRLQILSRLDRMGKARPTPVRLLILIVLLFILIPVINHFYTRSVRDAHAAPTPKADDQIQFSFVGDVCMSRYIEKYAEMTSYDDLFVQSKELWGNSDLVFANLECTILDEPEKYEEAKKLIILPASTEALSSVIRSGINAISIANNHAVDYGVEGLEYELAQLDKAGINYAGAGKNIEEASRVKILQCGDLKIGFLAFSSIPMEGIYRTGTTVAVHDYTEMYRNIREAADQTDLMIVYAHWGLENNVDINSTQRSLAHRLIESGADIVVGSHPHVLQRIETYNDGIIFYSLGNYLFDQGNRENRNSVMVQYNLDSTSGIGEFILVPIRINNFTPQETHSVYYINEIRSRLTGNLDSDKYYLTDDGRIHIPMSFKLCEKPRPEEEPEDTSLFPLGNR